MKLKFKKQQYQENAAQAVVKCFEGQSNGNRRDIIDRRHYIANEGTIWEEVVDEEVESYSRSSNRNDVARRAAQTAANTVVIAHR